MLRKLVFVAVTAAALATARGAFADDTAAADALFNDGKALRDAGNFAEACPKFEASFELSKAMGTILSVADCRENTGNLATALEWWDKAIALAKERNDERLSYAEKRKAELEPRVPFLQLDVKQGSEKLAVRVAGKDVPETKWGLPFHVDPGSVSVEVMRLEEVLDTRTVEVKEKDNQHVELDLAAIAKAHPPKKIVKPVEPVNPAQRYAGIVVLSVGLAGLVTFGILEGAAIAQRSEANGPGGCVDRDDGTSVCSPQGYDLATLAGDYAEAGQWIGVAGLATAAVGLTVFLTAPKDPPPEAGQPPKKRALVVVPWLAPSGAGLVVGGTL